MEAMVIKINRKKAHMTAFKLAVPRGNQGRLYEIIDPTEIAPENFRASPVSLLTFTVYLDISDRARLKAEFCFVYFFRGMPLCIFFYSISNSLKILCIRFCEP